LDIPQQKKANKKEEKTNFFAILFFSLFKLQARSETRRWLGSDRFRARRDQEKKVTLP